jgi:GNAT superfamily N-acetyltransferase/endonuclease/exonuclease/phosphatase family metal-dependent hydrolase
MTPLCDISVRLLKPGDHTEWLRLRHALWPLCADGMHALEMAEYTNPPGVGAVFVVARENGRLGGFAEVSIRDRVDGSVSKRVAYLEGWFVDPDLRGQGFGRKLVDGAERWAAARGLTEMGSDAELDNADSLKAHRALGFRETFRLVHYLKPLGALAGLLVLAVLTNDLRAASVTELKVMSFNIWVSGRGGLSNCIEVIRTSGADVVGLQECNAAAAQTIADALGFHAAADGDVSIVSRFPIAASIPTSGGRGVTLELGPGQRVHLFNCHLAAYPYGPYDLKNGRTQSFIIDQENSTRMPALNQLLSAMSPYLTTAEPCFLVGDFNAPSHFDYTDFPWPTSIACTNAGLIDSYHALHSSNRRYPGMFVFDEPGITWTPMTNQEPEGVFDRIDFVYFSPGDGLAATHSVELDGRNSISPWPSDHRAVLSTFALTPPPLTDKASSPVPPNGATNIALNPSLSWLAASNAISHTIFFGTNSPGIQVTNQTGTSFSPGVLRPDTKYAWRVDEVTASGTVTGNVWRFTTKSTNALAFEWTFDKSDLSAAIGTGIITYANGSTTSNFTIFGTSDGSTVPHINGQPATYLQTAGFTASNNGYLVTLTGTGPNGGGVYLNQFTIIYDLLVPGSLGWVPLFNTNPANANDADFYIRNDGAVGISAIGYSSAGIITANTWYRVAFAADLAADTVNYYIDGNPVFNGSATLDGRHSLYSDADAGPDLLLFNEGDPGAVYTHAACLSSLFFTSRTMSATEIHALGGPKARGVAVPPLPIQALASRQGSSTSLSWTGGDGPFQVQETTNLVNPDWKDFGGPLVGNSLSVSPNGAAAYFRIRGQ